MNSKTPPETELDAEALVVLETFRAVEARNADHLLELYHTDVEFSWPPSLPYGGTYRGGEIMEMSIAFAAVWDPLQPTESERRMDARVVASNNGEVVALYHQRGVDASGKRFETEVLGRYEVRNGLMMRAQMFYFDPSGLDAFLRNAAAKSTSTETCGSFDASLPQSVVAPSERADVIARCHNGSAGGVLWVFASKEN